MTTEQLLNHYYKYASTSYLRFGRYKDFKISYIKTLNYLIWLKHYSNIYKTFDYTTKFAIDCQIEWLKIKKSL